MSKKAKIKLISKERLRIYVLMLATMSLVLGMMVGSTTSKSIGDSTDRTFRQLMEEAMRSMDRGMDNAPMTGDPDHDFAAMMIPHHQGAIDMAKAELLYGKDTVLRRLAQEIIVNQEQEIDVMLIRLKQLKSK